MVPDLIWTPDFFGPKEIWLPRNLVSVWKYLNDFHAGTKFPGAQKWGAQMILGTISVTYSLKNDPKAASSTKCLPFWQSGRVWGPFIPSFCGLSDVRNRGMNTLFLCKRLFEVAYKLKCLPYYEAQIPHYGLWKKEFGHI